MIQSEACDACTTRGGFHTSFKDFSMHLVDSSVGHRIFFRAASFSNGKSANSAHCRYASIDNNQLNSSNIL